MPSASRSTYRAGLLVVCVLLLTGAVSGCTTTQDTAAEKQAESKRILEKREQKQKLRKADRKDQEG
ncbi:MAG: hypothetical protein QOF13_954 [Solirubrobacterales bacterium]|nr:hypothetical protein [Solirubrobacterales bacterium]